MSNSTTVEKQPHKKRKLSTPPSSWSLLSSLPDEIVLSCMARVSRLDGAGLSLASKSYCSITTSPELYAERSILGCTENCLYVCLLIPPDPTPRWFVLRRGKSGNRLLGPITSFPSPPLEASSVVALDSGIYVIGGRIKGKPTSDVLFLDCWTHTWRQVPPMGVARAAAAAGVVDGKIYVFGGLFGGCLECDSSNWAEVFDPKTQTWDPFPPMPDQEVRSKYILEGTVFVSGEKIYALDGLANLFYYSTSESKWGRGNTPQIQGNKRDWCFIDKLIYSITCKGNLCWCEPEQLECSELGEMCWKKVNGLGSLQESLFRSRLVHFDGTLEAMWEYSYRVMLGRTEKLIDLLPGARLCTSGPNVVLFWDVIEGDRLEIWCAEISLERRQGPEIWGNIEWSNVVMTVDPFLHHYKVLHSISVTL